jgi:hypothetical protein
MKLLKTSVLLFILLAIAPILNAQTSPQQNRAKKDIEWSLCSRDKQKILSSWVEDENRHSNKARVFVL